MLKRIILSVLLSLFSINAHAVITLPVFNDNATAHTGYVAFNGVPIHIDDSTPLTTSLKVTSDESGLTEIDAQFDVISRYDEDNDGAEITDKIRTVMVTFQADVLANSSKNYYLQIGAGGGNAAGSDMITDETGYHQIATGNLTARIKETSGFNLFDKVTVDSVDVISAPTSDGIVMVADTGVSYGSYNTNDLPVLEIIYNGPLFCLLKASSHVEDASNNPYIPPGTNPTAVYPVSFDVFYWAYKDERIVHTGFRLKNENQGYAGQNGTTNRNAIIDTLSLKTTLTGLGTITEVDFDDWSDTTTPTGIYTLQQDHCLPGTCAQNSESDNETTPNFNYYIKEGSTTQYTGRRFDSYSQMRDANRGIMVSQEYQWENWPNDVELDATNKTATVYLLPDKAADYVFLGASWKYWHVMWDFHDSSATDFRSEIAEIKKPLKVLLGNQVSLSRFFGDYSHPLFAFSELAGGGEDIGDALVDWERDVLSTWDDSYSDDTGFKHKDFTDIREDRTVSSTDGAYNGPMDMYGWLKFGDFIIGTTGCGGQGALNYEWNYIEILNGHRHQKYGMLKLGEQMSIKTVDQLTIHSPVDDSTYLNSSATSRILHGGNVGECDGDTALLNYTSGNQSYDHRNWMHGHALGALLEYGLTGKPWIKDGLDDIGDLLRYNYGGMVPDHGEFGALGATTWDVVNGNPTYWINLEVRAYVRSMGIATSMYQFTGDMDYYIIAKAIFENVLIPSEDTGGGYLRTQNYPLYAPWYTIQSFKYNMMLYHVALESGDTQLAADIAAFMTRSADWFWRMSQEDLASPAGVYSGGNYYPHSTYQYWAEDSGYSGVFHSDYMNEVADLYSFVYEQTGDTVWLTRARDNFKDPMFYTDNDFYGYGSESLVPENTVSMGSQGLLDAGNRTSWMKVGKDTHRPMHYLNMEYNITEGWEPPPEGSGSGNTFIGSGNTFIGTGSFF